MKYKMFSDAHLQDAAKIFPKKFGNIKWHNTKWTDEEINLSKLLRIRNLSETPA